MVAEAQQTAQAMTDDGSRLNERESDR